MQNSIKVLSSAKYNKNYFVVSNCGLLLYLIFIQEYFIVNS